MRSAHARTSRAPAHCDIRTTHAWGVRRPSACCGRDVRRTLPHPTRSACCASRHRTHASASDVQRVLPSRHKRAPGHPTRSACCGRDIGRTLPHPTYSACCASRHKRTPGYPTRSACCRQDVRRTLPHPTRSACCGRDIGRTLGHPTPKRIRRLARAAVVDVRSCSVRAYGQMGSARAVAAHGAFPLATRTLSRAARVRPVLLFRPKMRISAHFGPLFSFSTQSASKTRKTSVNSAWANLGPESKKFITIV